MTNESVHVSEQVRVRAKRASLQGGKRGGMPANTILNPSAYTAREKYCSMLASCAMCEETCSKTMKWSGKRKRMSHMSLKWLTMPSLVMYGCRSAPSAS